MATIEINGVACVFPRVPYGTLESWPATSRTHYLAYKLSDNPLHNSTIAAMLSTAYDFGAFSRPPFWVHDEDGTAVVLLENASRSVMDTITTWLTWTIGANHLYLYPYQRALTGLRLQYEEMGKDIERTAELLQYKKQYSRLSKAGNPLKTPSDNADTDN